MDASSALSCETLNRKFGAPERIVFRPMPETGSIVAVLANKYGTCEVDLFGARVMSYRPTGQPQVLFFPKEKKTDPRGSEHGGVPVCWPWFGRNGEPGTAGHGIARRFMFEVRASEYSDDATEITLGLASDPETRKLWPYDFDLELKVSVSMSLNVTLKSKNTGTEKFWCTEGLHPYFLLSGIGTAMVRGLDGRLYCDANKSKPDGSAFRHADLAQKWTGDLSVDTCYDHVFAIDDAECSIFDPGLKRTIVVRARGTNKIVVWCPAPEAVNGNMAPDDWKRMVCVEPATLFRDDGYWLEPGATHEVRMAIQSDPNDGSVHSRN